MTIQEAIEKVSAMKCAVKYKNGETEDCGLFVSDLTITDGVAVGAVSTYGTKEVSFMFGYPVIEKAANGECYPSLQELASALPAILAWGGKELSFFNADGGGGCRVAKGQLLSQERETRLFSEF